MTPFLKKGKKTKTTHSIHKKQWKDTGKRVSSRSDGGEARMDGDKKI
jgi:hypothetical protein